MLICVHEYCTNATQMQAQLVEIRLHQQYQLLQLDLVQV
jgi:hypothetical protein